MREQGEKIRRQILEQIDLGRDYEDEEIREMIRQLIDAEAYASPMTIAERLRLEEDVFNSLRRLDILQSLIDDPTITEILVNGSRNIFYERDGRLHRYAGSFRSEEALADMIQNIVGNHNRVVNQSNPIVDTRLPDGSRVNIVLAPIAIDGSAVSIRKFPEKPLQMTELVRMGSIDAEAAEFLKLLVEARYSIFISGGTGSGKTTFLNALSQFIPKEERIITIEDSAELQLLEQENIVRLETRNSNMEGVTPIAVRDLIRTALRMRPDRIIVGECRGEEALDMLSAMNTGHDGSLSTGHANSCRDILFRLETMVMMGKELPMTAVRNQIASGIDIIIQLGRLRDGTRRVLEIAEMKGVEKGEILLNPLYLFEETGNDEMGHVKGHLKQLNKLYHREKLQFAGREEELPDGL